MIYRKFLKIEECEIREEVKELQAMGVYIPQKI
jgi:hypothetical protein